MVFNEKQKKLYQEILKWEKKQFKTSQAHSDALNRVRNMSKTTKQDGSNEIRQTTNSHEAQLLTNPARGNSAVGL